MYRDDEKGEEVALDAVRSQQPQMSTGLVGDGREQIEGVLAFADLPEPGAGALAADQHLFDGLGF